nr:eukaryotic translation initiation factor 3 subunit E-like [Parasteatoda tepidariorum]
MAKWDLTPKIAQYLDRHLVFPLLEFMSVKEIYDERDMLLAKLDIVRNTKMIDFAIDCHKLLYPGTNIPEGKGSFLPTFYNKFYHCVSETVMYLYSSICH